MPKRFTPPTLTESRKQKLLAEARSAEHARHVAAQRRARAIHELFVALGAAETGRLLGISRQRVYQVADTVDA